ncbi:hypothetical protein JCM10450v2_000814 [Rhodotorula kratochvilovae]
MLPVKLLVNGSGYTALWDEAALAPLISPFFDLAQLPSPRPSLHVTLLTKEEARSLAERGVANPFLDATFTSSDLVPLGLSGNDATFLVLLSPKLNALRLSAGLPLADLHITLLTPPHASPSSVPHGLSTLRTPPPSTSTALDALAHHYLLARDYPASRAAAARACALDPASSRPLVRLGDAAARLGQCKLAHLAYAQAWERANKGGDERVRAYAGERMARTARGTEWGTTYLGGEGAELEDLSDGVQDLLLKPWSEALREEARERAEGMGAPQLCVEARKKRWIVPFHLAISSIPRASDIPLLASPALGIRHIITLCAESPLPATWLEPHAVRNTFLPVEDYHAPTVAQLQLFLHLLAESDGPVLVHCAGGKGRAGTFVAAYLTAFGLARPPQRWTHPASWPAQALQDLRRMRPASVETGAQEQVLKAFSAHLQAGGSPFPAEPDEPPSCGPVYDGTVSPAADLIVLVGLPGSGKTHFRRMLQARDARWRAVSGDEDGGTSAVHAAASSFRPGDALILDRCNPTPAERKTLLALAQHARCPVAVFFDFPREVCAARALRRADHPSLPPGPRVHAALAHFSRGLVPPSREEGFAGIATVRSRAAADDVARRLSGTERVPLLKFPRTPHALDLGAATADDLLLPTSSPARAVRRGAQVVVTEKVDGANLAFSLSAEGVLRVQNRSHYIDAGAHAQFRALERWMAAHEKGLRDVLGKDEYFPGRFVLYGEWMAATHSIAYNNLPSLFLAYDLYDRTLSAFLPRAALEARLARTRIPLVPVLDVRSTWPSAEELAALAEGPSAFIRAEEGADGRREGVYLKLEDAERVLDRAKVVRGDFIAGNAHWTRAPLRLNTLSPEAEAVWHVREAA